MAESDDEVFDRFTTAQKTEANENLSSAITSAVAELQMAFPDQVIEALQWNDHYTAVPLIVDVELPSRGPIGGVDVRRREPIYLLFDRLEYPYKAPFAYSDRRDFPKTTLPHLNMTATGKAASFCLHRGDLNTWFAEHGIVDLVGRVRSWLRDAARDRLVPQQDKFEPTRAYDTVGQLVYDARELHALRGSAQGQAGYQFVMYELLDDKAQEAIGLQGYTARAIALPHLALPQQRAFAGVVNELAGKPEYQNRFSKRLFGIFAWPQSELTTAEYFGELPQTLGELLHWADARVFPLRQALSEYLANDLHLFAGVPVVLAIRRPREVIGAEGDIELLNFIIIAGGDHWPKDGVWNQDARVWFTDHRTPLTPEFARYLSSHDRSASVGRILMLGCGALGSKVSLHFARSGQTAMTLVDLASLSPHNVVRHALGGRHIGKAKSEALRDFAVALFPGQSAENLGLTASTSGAFEYLFGSRRDELDQHTFLVDATASTSVLNMLAQADLPAQLRVARSEIARGGKLGVLSIEGKGRNPRLDDLQVALFDVALTDDDVSGWLRAAREARETQVGSGLEEIQVGVSCSSATMRLADETVALHAAVASGRLRDAMITAAPGCVHRTTIGADGSIRSMQSDVRPVTIVTARNDGSWQVRFSAGLDVQMANRLRHARPNETGGLLVGMVHAKRRIVYVTRLLDAPSDSDGSPLEFFRGVQGLPDAVHTIEERSGGLLGYVGEWHSHPDGGPDLSPKDLIAVARLKIKLDRVPMPTIVTVVTPRGIYPHVFSAGGDTLRLRTREYRIVRNAK